MGSHFSRLTAFGAGVLVAASEIKYLKPLFHRHTPVPIDVWVTRIGAASFNLAYEVHDHAAATYARATSGCDVVLPGGGGSPGLSRASSSWSMRNGL